MQVTGIDTEELSFSEFYIRYYDKLCDYFRFRIPETECPEDLAQDAFMKFLENGTALNSYSSCLLYAIARNMAVDSIRRYYKREGRDNILKLTVETTANIVEEELNYQELQNRYEQQVMRLSPQRRFIFDRMETSEHTAAQVAEELKVSVRTVNNQLYMARRQIRSALR